jgi:hypothetical protein
MDVIAKERLADAMHHSFPLLYFMLNFPLNERTKSGKKFRLGKIGVKKP